MNAPHMNAPMGGAGGPSGGGPGGYVPQQGAPSGGPQGGPTMSAGNGQATALAPQADLALARYPSFEHVLELIRVKRDGLLLEYVKTYLRLVSYQPGRITIQPTDDAPKDLAARLGQQLQNWTHARWVISLANEGGGETITERENAAENALRAEASKHPIVQAVLENFPKAKITKIRTAEDLAAEVQAEALPEVEDEWDPFEEE